jgi:hypothetical protein
MEHRYYPRLIAPLEVDLYRRDERLGRYQTRDISLDGLFLKTGPIGLAAGDGLRLRLGMCGDKFWMQGIVAHVREEGLGIMLHPLNRDVFYAIFDLFRSRQVRLRRTVFGPERPAPVAEPAPLRQSPPLEVKPR